MDVIAFGAGLAFLCYNERFHRIAARLQSIGALALAAVLLGLIGSSYLAYRWEGYENVGHRTVAGFFSAALIYLVVGFSNKSVRRVLEWRPLVSIGVVSYGIYVWQQLFTGRSHLPIWFSTWPTNIIIIAMVATLSYFLIERPFIRIKERGRRKSVEREQMPLVDREAECVRAFGTA
jgi:peptidoglycan/LPS O-acetylase OafA/YrhL